MEVKKFVVGRDEFPEWFNDQALKGRAKTNIDDSGELINITISAPTKRLIAGIGDTIMLLKSGLTVVPKEKAAKYMPEHGKRVKEDLQ